MSKSECYISIHPREGKSFRHFHKNKNPRDTNFTIGGFLAGLPRSPLILCCFFRIFKCFLITDARDIQPTDFIVFISCNLSSAISLSSFLRSAISFSEKRLQLFGQDQGLLVQAIRRVGMPPVIPTAIVNQRQSCIHPLFNMYNPWQAP